MIPDAYEDTPTEFFKKYNLLWSKVTQILDLNNQVVRESCLQYIERVDNWKVMTIVAPAGFGKTNLVRQWLFKKGGKFCWLTLGKEENAINRFVQYLIAGFKLLDKNFGDDVLPLLNHPRPDIQSIGNQIISEITSSRFFVSIILDDYHLIENDEVRLLLQHLIDHMPANAQLIVVSREAVSLKLARHRVAGMLCEITQKSLSFSHDEITSLFLNILKISLNQEQVGILKQRTEGWVTALQLWAMSLGSGVVAPENINCFFDCHQFIREYLFEEVLAKQNRQKQTFLLSTSILDNFNASLCEAVTQLPDSYGLLNSLEKSNAFLTAIDCEGKWYRYHQLFGVLLQEKFRLTYDSDQQAHFHQSASAWYEQNGDVQEAAHHAFESADSHYIDAFLERNMEKQIFKGQLSQIFCWLNTIDETKIASPIVLIWLSWARLFAHKIEAYVIEHSLLKIQQLCESRPGKCRDSYELIQAHIGAINGFLATYRGDYEKGIQMSLAVLNEYPQMKAQVQGAIAYNLARSYLYSGQITDAIEYADLSIVGSYSSKNFYVATASTYIKGQALIQQAQIEDAEALFSSSLKMMEDRNIIISPFYSYLYIGLAETYYYRNSLERAEFYALQGIQCGEVQSETKCMAKGYMLMAQIQQVLQNDHQSQFYADKASKLTENLSSLTCIKEIQIFKAFMDCYNSQIHSMDEWIKVVGFPTQRAYTELSEWEALVLAKALTVKMQPDAALEIIQWIEKYATEYGRLLSLAKAALIKSIALHQAGRQLESIEALQESVRICCDKNIEIIFWQDCEYIQDILTDKLNTMPGMFFHSLKETFNTLKQKKNGNICRYKKVLTLREAEVMANIREGLSNKAIGEKMSISEGTVKRHIHNIFAKLKVKNRVEAIRYQAEAVGRISE